MLLNPYLNFPGNCEQAFNFYKSVFGGEFGHISRFKDMPPQEGVTLPPGADEKVMHISLPIGNGNMLMGSDAGEWSPPISFGNNFTLSITAESREEADRIFSALAKGGNVTMPLADAFWGDYFGMCTDKFKVNWMMSFSKRQ
jgi:PhnB protein